MTKPNDPAAVGGVGIGAVPKQQRGIAVRDRLLEAAIEEFTEWGVDDSRVERIVKRAGTSWGTFFRYFPRKEDVYLLETARQYREYMKPIYEEARQDPSVPVETSLRRLFAQLIKPRRPPRFHAGMINETVQHPVRLAAIIGEGEVPLAALVADLVEIGQKRGEIRSDVPAQLCGMVLTAGVMFPCSYALRAVSEGILPADEIERIHRQSFDLAWDGLRLQSGEPGPAIGGTDVAALT